MIDIGETNPSQLKKSGSKDIKLLRYCKCANFSFREHVSRPTSLYSDHVDAAAYWQEDLTFAHQKYFLEPMPPQPQPYTYPFSTSIKQSPLRPPIVRTQVPPPHLFLQCTAPSSESSPKASRQKRYRYELYVSSRHNDL
jgi:hypothetical protein